MDGFLFNNLGLSLRLVLNKGSFTQLPKSFF